ncbi:cytochrome c1 [Thiosulfativibrio zosterae]|uniref:Cytochrome c n=1 Tax=Thiosulfativibrio zosterae TaxID=2675053 RepID=A0A6F8PMF5_9GAMM|nr:cytochrome c1 [Thiosulfativibrio zosterae]BBP43227.1 cytochrome c [Thiosulfativibrio zosterae]
MKKMFQVFSMLTLIALSSAASAAGGHGLALDKAHNDIRDTESLQRGAVLFANYCLACHSLKYMRYNRIANDLGWSNEEVVAKLTYGMNKPVDIVNSHMQEGVALDVFGTEVPDLSLMARLKGPDYIYTFIRAYHQDEQGNWDNKILVGTAMPNVLEGLKRHQSAEDFDQTTRDITNFLEYVGEPIKVTRYDLGIKVMLFLFVLFILTYLLKREYWRDIKH